MSFEKPEGSDAWAEVLPFSDRVFKKRELNQCCRSQKGKFGQDVLPIGDVLKKIRAAAPSEDQMAGWEKKSVRDIAMYVLSSFHRPLATRVVNAETLLQMVADSHRGAAPSDIAKLSLAFDALQDELMFHLLLEEDILYPWILSGNGWSAFEMIDDLRAQHDVLLRKMKTVLAAADRLLDRTAACEGSRALLTTLYMIETMLLSHVMFENNVLFERTLEEQPTV